MAPLRLGTASPRQATPQQRAESYRTPAPGGASTALALPLGKLVVGVQPAAVPESRGEGWDSLGVLSATFFLRAASEHRAAHGWSGRSFTL